MNARLVLFTAVVTMLGSITTSRADKIYVTSLSYGPESPAHRMNLDGSAEEELFPALAPFSSADDTAVDSRNAKLYVILSLESGRGLYRADLDGSNLKLLISLPVHGLEATASVDVDPQHQKVYWARGLRSIFRMDAAGGVPEQVPFSGGVLDLAVDPGREQVYWLAADGELIFRVHVSGGAVETIYFNGGSEIHDIGGLDLDLVNRRIYWVSQDQRIRTVSMDGGEVQIIREEVGYPMDIAVDAPRGHIYWTLHLSGNVLRANLDGTERTVVASDLSFPFGIALQLDCGNGRIDPGEACDVAIEPGWTGECVTECRDDDPCTSDEVSGFGTCSARCEFETITEPIDRDGCCPSDSFTLVDDSDCTLSPWPDVPAVSTWGAALSALLLAVGITLKWRSHHAAAYAAGQAI